jgi:hypothetical protein
MLLTPMSKGVSYGCIWWQSFQNDDDESYIKGFQHGRRCWGQGF